MPEPMADLNRLAGHEQAERLRSGLVSVRELTVAHLDAAERQNHALNAWLTIDRERALGEADAADVRLVAARRAGPTDVEALPPLFGLPLALKDLVSLAGGRWERGRAG